MGSNVMAQKIICTILIVAILLFANGCTTDVFREDQLRAKSDYDITVHLKDGRIIKFKQGDYKVVDADSGSIQGKGIVDVNEGFNKYKKFEGTIPFNDIREITETRTTTFGKITLITIGVVAALGVITLAIFVYAYGHTYGVH